MIARKELPVWLSDKAISKSLFSSTITGSVFIYEQAFNFNWKLHLAFKSKVVIKPTVSFKFSVCIGKIEGGSCY